MQFQWDDAPGENVEHVTEHGLTIDDVEHAFENIVRITQSRSSDKPALFGLTPSGEMIFVSYHVDYDDEGKQFIYVITAYQTEDE